MILNDRKSSLRLYFDLYGSRFVRNGCVRDSMYDWLELSEIGILACTSKKKKIFFWSKKTQKSSILQVQISYGSVQHHRRSFGTLESTLRQTKNQSKKTQNFEPGLGREISAKYQMFTYSFFNTFLTRWIKFQVLIINNK